MAEDTAARAPRLLSLDALRGFDMMWILGGDTIVRLAAKHADSPALRSLAKQMTHADWAGVRAYDLIFPLFMFLSGVAIPFALDGRIARGELTRGAAVKKVLVRVVVLTVLGMLYNGLLAGSGEPRFASVLGQIGIAYGIAALTHLFVPKPLGRAGVFAGILVAVSLIQRLAPVPGFGAGVLTPDGSVNAWIDRMLLPGKLYGGSHDPEGLLCILSSATLTIAGSLFGAILRKPEPRPWRRAGLFTLTGLVTLAAGFALEAAGYPPVKKLWTVPFNLIALGWSALAFTLFHVVIDLAGFSRWSFPLRVIGMNALAAYLLNAIVPFRDVAGFFFGRLAEATDTPGLVLATGVLLVQWALLYALWKKKVFISV